MTIKHLQKAVCDSELSLLDGLLSQLGPNYPLPLSNSYIAERIAQPGNAIFLAYDNAGVVAGVITLTTLRALSGDKVWIEDFIVDKAQRGKGIGRALDSAIRHAKAQGVTHINLTARSSRNDASRLYLKAGFEINDTNYYRLRLRPGRGQVGINDRSVTS